MKEIKICFLQTSFSNEQVLKIFSKMTPKRSGKWKNLVGITDIDKADFIIVIDNTSKENREKLIPEKTIYIGAHPYEHAHYQCFDDKKCIAKLDQRDDIGFCEFWLDEDYDTLMKLESPKKTKNLSCIMSNERDQIFHKIRIKFMINFCNKYPEKVDLYGRIHPQGEEEQCLNKSYKGLLGVDKGNPEWVNKFWFGKTPALLPYRHSLEFIAPNNGNYLGERFFDAILLWAMPLYNAGKNAIKYFPKNSFRYLNPETDTPEYILDIVNSDFREKHIKDIAEARYLILTKYQIWNRVYDIIKGL